LSPILPAFFKFDFFKKIWKDGDDIHSEGENSTRTIPRLAITGSGIKPDSLGPTSALAMED